MTFDYISEHQYLIHRIFKQIYWYKAVIYVIDVKLWHLSDNNNPFALSAFLRRPQDW